MNLLQKGKTMLLSSGLIILYFIAMTAGAVSILADSVRKEKRRDAARDRRRAA